MQLYANKSTQIKDLTPQQIQQMQEFEPQSKIAQFYAHQSVFMTGASGFVGKVLLEKLLRTCSDLKQIFILIRPKRNKQPKERIDELIKCRLFNYVRERNLQQKLVLVEGDMMLDNLGISSDLRAQICSQVSIIIHSAATVKFDELLRLSVNININGTKNVIRLARQLQNLRSIVHVSTAYANCDRKSVDEHVYPVSEDPEKLMQMAEWMDTDTMQLLRDKLLRDKPNTYTYTKSICEWMLVEEARDLPIAVCRPSIVLASWKEPFAGWIDNLNGPTGPLAGILKGVVRSLHIEGKNVVDIIPVDTVVNMILSLGWFAHEYHKVKSVGKQVNQSSASSESCFGEDEEQSSMSPISSPLVGRVENSSNPNSNVSSQTTDQQTKDEHKSSKQAKIKQFEEEFEKSKSDDGYISHQASYDCDEEECSSSMSSNESHSNLGNLKGVDNNKLLIRQKMIQFRKKQQKVLAEKNLPSKIADIPIFHCSTSASKPIKWFTLEHYIYIAVIFFPTVSFFRFPAKVMTPNKFVHSFYDVVCHTFPAILIDIFLKSQGAKTFAMQVCQKCRLAANTMSPFMLKEWRFDNSNNSFLNEMLMSEADKKLFNFDTSQLNWKDYCYDYYLGMRTTILKEKETTLEKARKDGYRVYYRNLAIRIIVYAMLAYPIVTRVASSSLFSRLVQQTTVLF